MNKRKIDRVLFLVYVYQAILVIASAFILTREGEALVDSLLSEPPAILGILLISAIVVEARPVRWTATQNTTLVPIVLLLTLMLVKDPVLVVAISGIGALVGYGLLRELRLNFRTTSRALMRVLFYTTQAVVASGITASLYSLLPGSTRTAFMLDAAIGFGLVVVYMLCSKGFVSAYNRLASLNWAGDTPLPSPSLLVFLLMAIAPLITMWFYRIVPEGNYFVVELVGRETLRSLVILCVWPLALLFVYVASPYLTIGFESEEMKKDYVQFSRYSEKMLDMAGITELIARDMQLEFECDDCIIYSWNDKEMTYELEGGLIGGQPELRTSAEAMPDVDWPRAVEPKNSALGRAVERGQLCSFQGGGARDFLKDVGLSSTRYTSLLVVPLRYVREVSSDIVRVGSVVLLKREGIFGYSQRIEAARLLDHPTPVHIGLRQARLYRDAQQFFNDINAAVSKSGEALAATQALFSKGIDPAVFVTGVRRGVHTRSLLNVVKNISEGRSPDEGIDLLDDEGMEKLYERLKRDDSNLPELTDEIRGHLRTFVSSLSVSFVIPYRWPRPEYSRITSEMRGLYRILLSALEANTVDDILAFDARLSAQARLERLRADFPEAVGELSSLQELVETIRLSQADGVDDETRVDRLSEALRMLDRADGDGRGSPEQAVIAQIRDLWASVLYHKREELLGQSDIIMQLETRTAILSIEGIIVSLRVGNRGRSAATGVVVRLAPSESYAILGEVEPDISRVERLGPGQSHELSFRILPKREDFVRLAFKAVWSDRVRADRTASYADRVVLRPEASVFVPIDNPYVPGPPLRPGNSLFMGREDVFEFVRSNIGTRGQHNVLMLTGQRRAGKTSLALHLPEKLDRDRYVVAYVDCQALGTEPGMSVFLRDLAWMICDGLEEYDIECEPVSFEETGRTATERFRREFLPAVFSSLGERSLVLVFDEFEGLEKLVDERKVDDTVFGFLRHLMQHTPDLAFVLVGTHRLQELSQDYSSILYSIALQKRIGFLDEQSARRLITALPEQDIFDPLAVEEILQFTAGHPYLIQFLCHYLVDLRNRTHSQIVTAQHVRDAIAEVLVQAEGYFVNLWQMATVDERMIMASASRVLARQVTVQAGELVEQLAAYEVYLDIEDIRSSEAALVAREIFRRMDGDPPRYRFKVELFRRWIDRNQPLSLVVGSWT